MSPRKKQQRKKEESLTDRLQNLNITKSYTSLAYGVITVVVIFILIVVGIRAFTQQQQQGDTTDESAVTQEGEVYTVQEGETLWDIAEKFYGTGFDWEKIAQANNIENPDAIEKGMKLTIPKQEELAQGTDEEEAQESTEEQMQEEEPTATPTVEPTVVQPTPTPTTEPKVGGGEAIKSGKYKVAQGDYLWDIAVRAYGDGFRWVDIYHANMEKISNPDLIYPDQELTIPRN